MELQMGPSHPATHGTIKFNLKLKGEKVLACDVEVGFLHRGFDKSCEQATWTQVIPYTDRLNYASSLINNVGYALAVEKLIGAETPLRSAMRTPNCTQGPQSSLIPATSLPANHAGAGASAQHF